MVGDWSEFTQEFSITEVNPISAVGTYAILTMWHYPYYCASSAPSFWVGPYLILYAELISNCQWLQGAGGFVICLFGFCKSVYHGCSLASRISFRCGWATPSLRKGVGDP